MATEAARHKLYNRLIEVLGADNAEFLMSSLPPVPVTRLATTDDVAAVKDEVAAVKDEVAAVKQDVAALRSDVWALRGEMREEIAALNQRLDVEIGVLNQRFDRVFIAQIATLVSVVAAIIASNTLF